MIPDQRGSLETAILNLQNAEYSHKESRVIPSCFSKKDQQISEQILNFLDNSRGFRAFSKEIVPFGNPFKFNYRRNLQKEPVSLGNVSLSDQESVLEYNPGKGTFRGEYVIYLG